MLAVEARWRGVARCARVARFKVLVHHIHIRVRRRATGGDSAMAWRLQVCYAVVMLTAEVRLRSSPQSAMTLTTRASISTALSLMKHMHAVVVTMIL